MKAIKEGQRPEMEKGKIIEVFQNNKQRFIELRDRMLLNGNASQIGFGHPPGAYLINFKWIGAKEFNFKDIENKFGIEEKWLRTTLEKMKEINCEVLQNSYVYEDVNSPDYQPTRHESLEFELEGGGIFGPDWTKGIAYYSHDYMPKTRENGFGGQGTFFQYFNKIEDNWYVYSRK